MVEIHESRYIKFRDIILTLVDIKKLAKVVIEEYENRKPLASSAWVRFSITCDDGSRFESKDADFFDDPIISSKRVMAIKMIYSASQEELKIEISHDASGIPGGIRDNVVQVEGLDSKWVNSTLKKLGEIIDGFTPQKSFVIQHPKISELLAAINIGIILIGIYSLLIPYSQPSSSLIMPPMLILILDTPLKIILIYFIYWMAGLLPAKILMPKINQLWPIVELQLGPEHKLTEKQRRIQISGFFLLVVVPIILDLAKQIFTSVILPFFG